MTSISIIVLLLFLGGCHAQSCFPNENYCQTCESAAACQLCHPTYFLTPAKTCEKCPTGCAECTSIIYCSSCLPTFVKSGDLCVCQHGKGVNYMSNTCVPCEDPKCTRCEQDFQYCAYCTGYFGPVNGVCTSCVDPRCWGCNSNHLYCQTCVDGFGRELTETGRCINCDDPNCRKCTSFSHLCIECKDGWGRVGDACEPC